MLSELPLKYRVKALLPAALWRALRRAREQARIVRTSPVHDSPLHQAADTLSCKIAYNELGGFCVPRASLHRPAAQSIVRGRIWEKNTLCFIASKAGEGDIVHAGTYYGDFLPALSSFCGPTARVWAFEPGRENFRCAEITIRINDLGNVTLINAGLGEAESDAGLVTRDAAGASLGGASNVVRLDATNRDAGSEAIRIVTIDGTIPEDRVISVIHLDVEGYEQKALTGALSTIRRCRPVLITESVPKRDWFDRHLVVLGYARQGMVEGNTVFAAQG